MAGPVWESLLAAHPLSCLPAPAEGCLNTEARKSTARSGNSLLRASGKPCTSSYSSAQKGRQGGCSGGAVPADATAHAGSLDRVGGVPQAVGIHGLLLTQAQRRDGLHIDGRSARNQRPPGGLSCRQPYRAQCRFVGSSHTGSRGRRTRPDRASQARALWTSGECSAGAMPWVRV